MNCPCDYCNEHNPLGNDKCVKCNSWHLTDRYHCSSQEDPFKRRYNKPCKHCDGNGSYTVTEQVPPDGLQVCRSCGGGGLLYWHPWDDEDQKSHVEHCSQCNGLRYQKAEISKKWQDLHEQCKGKISFDLEECRGVALTVEEGRAFGLTPVELPKL